LFASRVYGDEDPAKELVGMLNARYGAIFQDNFIWKFGIDVMKIEKDFNRQAGHSDVERLPDFMREEALMPWGKRFDVDELELQNFYSSVDEINFP
jgi:aldehyde:ferredoxin oxidoreductase